MTSKLNSLLPLQKSFNLDHEQTDLGLLSDKNNKACDQALESVNLETQALERGDLSQFDPSKLKKLLSFLKIEIQTVRNENIGIKTLNTSLSNLILIEDSICSYLNISKKIIGSNGHKYSKARKEIQKFLYKANKTRDLQDFESPGIFWEFYDAIRHPLKTLFPTVEEQKNQIREKFFNKARSFQSFLRNFTVTPKLDRSQKLALQREAKRIQANDLYAETGMSESRKRFWNGAFYLLQLGTQAIDFLKKDSWDTTLNKEIAKHHKPPLTKAQEREVAFVGKSVGEKLPAIRSMSEEEFMRFTQRYPKTRSFLNEYRKSKTSVKPEEASLIMEKYRAQEMSRPPFIDLIGASQPPQSPKSPPEPRHTPTTALTKWVETPPLPVNDRLLAHILGESFAEQSGLEGYVSDQMRDFISDAIEKRRTVAKDPTPYEEILSQFEVAAKFSLALKSGTKELIEVFDSELSKLKNENRFFFQTTWQGKPFGHAIVLEVQKQKNNLFTFRIFNSGLGLQHHKKAIINNRLYHERYFEIQDVHKSRLTSVPFCESLCRMTSLPPYGKWSGIELYEALVTHLKGKKTFKQLNLKKMSTTNSVGFCTYLSLSHWMQDFAPDIFDRWQIEFQTKVFSDFAKNADLHSEKTLKLIQKSGQQLARNAQSSFEQGIISEAEWGEIQNIIGQAAFEEISVPFLNSLESSPFQTQANNFPKFKTLNGLRKIQGKRINLLPINSENFQPETFAKETSNWRKHFVQENEKGNYKIVKTAILEWIEKIPFERKDELIAALQPQEALKLLNELNEIGKDYLFSELMIQKLSRPKNVQSPLPVLPRTALTSIKLFTLAHALNVAFEEYGGISLPDLYQHGMDLLLEGKSGSNHLFSPEDENDLILLRDYWRNAEPIEMRRKDLSFFGFEYIPASINNPPQKYKSREIFETKEERELISPYDNWAAIDWPDLVWMKNYIKNPEIQQKIAQVPELAFQPLTTQAHILLHGNDEKLSKTGFKRSSILPQAFIDLFELSFLVDFVMGAPVVDIDNEQPLKRDLGIQSASYFRYSKEDKTSPKIWGSTRTIFGHSTFSTLPFYIISKVGLKDAVGFDQNYGLTLTQNPITPLKKPLYGLQRLQNSLESEYYYKLHADSFTRNRLTTSNRLQELPSHPEILNTCDTKKPRAAHWSIGVQEVPLQQMREKLALSTDPSLQVRETFAYYKKNHELLRDREEQTFFKKLLFEPPLLLEFLTQNPKEAKKFISEFEKFCLNGAQKYTKLENPMLTAFYLEIANKFQKYRSFLSKKYPQLIHYGAKELLPAKQLRSLIDKKIHHPKDEVFLYLNLILMQSPETLDINGAIDLIEALIHVQTVPWPKKTLIGKIREDINTIDGEYLNPDYPFEQESLVKPHLLRLRVPLEKLLKGSQRDDILNTVMQRLTPGFKKNQWKASPQFPYFETLDESTFLDLSDGSLYHNTAKVAALPRVFYENPELQPFLDPTQMTLGFVIAPGVYEFTSINSEKLRVFNDKLQNYNENNEETLTIQKEIEGKFFQKIQPFSALPESLKEYGDHWLSLEAPHTLWIGDQIHASFSGTQIKAIHRIDTGWKLADPKTPSSSPLLQIEDSDYILPWTDPETGAMKQLELPRLSLQFNFDAEGNVSTSRFDGYRIAKEQYISSFGNLRNYLTMENSSKKLAMLPAYRRKIDQGKNLETNSSFDRNQSAELLVFEVDSKGQLVPTNSVARYYLSYLLLTEQRYEEARLYLEGTKSEISSLKEPEKKILAWILDVTQDSDPRAIALRIKTLLLLLRDQDHFFSENFLESENVFYVEEHTEKHTLSKDYANLLQKWPHIPPRFRPSPEDEKILSRFFGHSSVLQIYSRFNNVTSVDINFSSEFLKSTSAARNLLLNPQRAAHLFKISSSNINTERTEYSVLRTENWNHHFILEAYKHLRNPTDDGLRNFYHRNFFPRIKLRSEENVRQKIRENLEIVVRSESIPKDRAIAALLLGVLKAPEAFPTFSELSNAISNEMLRIKTSRYNGTDFSTWANMHLSKPLELYSEHYLPSSAESYRLNFFQSEKKPLKSLVGGQSTHLLSQPIIPDVNLKPLFSKAPKRPFDEAHQNLIEVFSSEDTMIQQLKEFIQSPKASPGSYSLKKKALLAELERSTTQSSLKALERTEELSIDLLEMANRLNHDPILRLGQTGAYLSDQEKPIEMPELLKHFLTLDVDELRRRNPALSIDECHEIHRKTHDFLVIATQRQHLERLSQKCRAIHDSEGSDRDRLIEELAKQGGQKRAYAPEQYPDLLLLEYGSNIRLRKEQVEALNTLSPGTAQEMIMGSGKTMVLLPLLALKAANGENLSMIVMPHELLPSMAESLEKTLGKAFGQSIDVLAFNRNTRLDINRLTRIHERLEKAIQKRRVVAMSGSSLQSLFLMAIDSFYRNTPEAPMYRKVLSLIKRSGNLILDEMHILLDVLQAHHFSNGQKEPLSKAEKKESMQLFEHLCSLGWDGKKGIPKIEYEQNLKQQLVDKTLANERFSSYSKPALKNYLLENLSNQSSIYVDRIESQEIKDALAIFKEQINRVFPLVLSKQIDEHFGNIPEGSQYNGYSQRVAIPYHGSQNPILNSQFGSEFETIDYTTILHLVKGLDTEIIKKELKQIQVQILHEIKSIQAKNIRQVPSYQRFVEMVGSENYSPFTEQPQEIEEIRSRINQKPQIKLQLIQSWIYPELYSYPKQLYTNGHIFPLLVSAIRGFSGTNWNSKTFPEAFHRQFQSDTRSYSLHLLQSNKLPTLFPQEPRVLLAQMTDESLADRGGFFREMKNIEVAQQMLQNSQNAKGVVFYEGDHLKVLTYNQQNPIPYSACPFAKEELLAFWDQKHTTGSDIPLSVDAKAVMTVSRHTHLFELLQSVWRLRKLHQGQKIQFAVPEQENGFIKQALHERIGRSTSLPLEIEDIFHYCWLQEKTRGEEHLARALKFKFNNELIKPVLDQIVDETKALPNAKILGSLFYKEKPETPYELYGQVTHPVPKEIAVKKQIQSILSSEVLKRLPFELRAQITKKIQEIAEIELPFLPKEISSSASDLETEVEIEIQTEQEVEVEQELQVEVETHKNHFELTRNYCPHGIISWEGPLSRTDFLASSAQLLLNLQFARANTYTLENFRNSGSLSPVVSIQDALQKLNIPIPFDSDLCASATFMPLFKETRSTENLMEPTDFVPFGQRQDIVQEALLIQELQTGQVRMILINQDEAKQFETRLSTERPLLENGVRLALYHLDYGLYAEGADFPSEETLHSSLHFMRLKVQAKFYNGEVYYSKQELKALESWFSELQTKGMLSQLKSQFEGKILKWKEQSATDYPHSPLFRLFERYQ